MSNYKITNLKTDAVYYFNEEQRSAFFRKNCYQDKNYNFNYEIEELSDTPIIDKLNKVAYSLLDIIVFFTMSLALGVIALEVLTNLIK